MKENTNRTNLSLKLDCGLVSFLKTQENHKFSRYDAFVWLVEHILDSDGRLRQTFFGISRLFSQIYRTGQDMALEQTYSSEIHWRAWSHVCNHQEKTCQCFCAVSYRRKHDSWQPYGFYHHPPHYRTDACIATFAALFDELAQTDKREAKIE